MNLMDLTPELIEEILARCDPVDVSRIAQTSTQMRAMIYFAEDSSLWRDLYLNQFDDPRCCIGHDGTPQPQPIDWKGDLQRIVRAQTVVQNWDILKPGELLSILQTLLALVYYVPPRLSADHLWNGFKFSHNLLWILCEMGRKDHFLDRVAKRAEDGVLTLHERQLGARLHTYYGLTNGDVSRMGVVKSLAFVYGEYEYDPDFNYGPFLPNGAVDWEIIQAVHHLLSMHIAPKDTAGQKDFTFLMNQMSAIMTQVVRPEGVVFDQEEDWAGVKGTWEISFCICIADDENNEVPPGER